MSRWVLVADNSHARLMNYRSKRLEPLDAIDHPAGRLYNRDINSDGQGRSDRSAGRTRGSDYQPLHDAKKHISEQFVKQLCQKLNQAKLQGEFDELYICAPPTMLGRLRAKMPRTVSQCVQKEVAKDLVGADDNQVMSNLR